jgi:hypothetical protein
MSKCAITSQKEINKGVKCESCYDKDTQFDSYKKCHINRLTSEREYWMNHFKNTLIEFINTNCATEKDKHEFLKRYKEHWAKAWNFSSELDNVHHKRFFTPSEYNLIPKDLIEVINNLMENEYPYHKGAWSTAKSHISNLGKKKLPDFNVDPLIYFRTVQDIKNRYWNELYNYNTIKNGGAKKKLKKPKKTKKRILTKKNRKKNRKVEIDKFKQDIDFILNNQSNNKYPNMTANDLIAFNDKILARHDNLHSPGDFQKKNRPIPNFAPVEEAIKLENKRKKTKPKPKQNSKIHRKLFGGKKSKRRRRRRRRKTTRKKR